MREAALTREEILVWMYAETRGLGEEDFEKIIREKNLIGVESWFFNGHTFIWRMFSHQISESILVALLHYFGTTTTLLNLFYNLRYVLDSFC